MSNRISSHKIDTQVTNNVRTIIDNGDCLFRELSARDYGVDAVIEVFENGEVTGKLALVQLKGTSKEILPLKTKPVISCQISTSSAKYALQKNIPMILINASLTNANKFYYVCLQEVRFEKQLLNKQKEITVHIPVENYIMDDLSTLLRVIDKYYL